MDFPAHLCECSLLGWAIGQESVKVVSQVASVHVPIKVLWSSFGINKWAVKDQPIHFHSPNPESRIPNQSIKAINHVDQATQTIRGSSTKQRRRGWYWRSNLQGEPAEKERGRRSRCKEEKCEELICIITSFTFNSPFDSCYSRGRFIR